MKLIEALKQEAFIQCNDLHELAEVIKLMAEQINNPRKPVFISLFKSGQFTLEANSDSPKSPVVAASTFINVNS